MKISSKVPKAVAIPQPQVIHSMRGKYYVVRFLRKVKGKTARSIGDMTGASPVTTLHGLARLCRAMVVTIVVTGLAPVMSTQPELQATLRVGETQSDKALG